MTTDTCYYDIQNICTPFTQDDFQVGDVITLCIFHINQEINTPFLEYLLYKYPDGKFKDQLIFPFIHYTNKHSLENQLRIFFNKVFNISIHQKGIEIKGLCHYNDQPYLFLDISLYITQITEQEYVSKKQRQDIWWDVIPFEIINTKHIFQFSIHPSVRDLFIHYRSLSYLTNKDQTPLPLPMAVYNGYSSNRILFTSVFSRNKSSYSKSELTYKGPFYYFTDYQGAFYFSYKKSKYKKHHNTPKGIVRSIVFTKKLTVFANLPTDSDQALIEPDKSLHKYRKLRDPYGNWSKSYDSTTMNHPLLEDGSQLESPFILTIKDNEDILPKYWGYFNIRDFSKKWSKHNKYYIN